MKTLNSCDVIGIFGLDIQGNKVKSIKKYEDTKFM